MSSSRSLKIQLDSDKSSQVEPYSNIVLNTSQIVRSPIGHFSVRITLMSDVAALHAVFSSGFAEATQVVNVDIANLPQSRTVHTEEDEDDMGVFEIEVEDEVRDTKRRKMEEGANRGPALEPSLRSMIEIKVTDTWSARSSLRRATLTLILSVPP